MANSEDNFVTSFVVIVLSQLHNQWYFLVAFCFHWCMCNVCDQRSHIGRWVRMFIWSSDFLKNLQHLHDLYNLTLPLALRTNKRKSGAVDFSEWPRQKVCLLRIELFGNILRIPLLQGPLCFGHLSALSAVSQTSACLELCLFYLPICPTVGQRLHCLVCKASSTFPELVAKLHAENRFLKSVG